MNSHDYQVNDILVDERGFFYQVLKTSHTTVTVSHISNTAKFDGVRRNDRGVLGGRELDIVVPKERVAIEFNGDYWHSDEFLRKSKGVSSLRYHQSKQNDAEINGFTLGFVWESDWLKRRREVQDALIFLLESRELPPLLNNLKGTVR